LAGKLRGNLALGEGTICPIDEPDDMTPTDGDEATGAM
jgi:hypothetical protein